MEPAKKTNGNLFEALSQHIKEPFLVMDINWNILSFNNSASEFLSLKGSNENLLNFLDDISVEELKKTIELNQPVISNITHNSILINNQGEETEVTLSFNTYQENGDNFIFCKILVKDNKIILGGRTEILVGKDDLENFIIDKNVFKIIDEIKSQYPFTIIGKSKIQKMVNDLSCLFWIEDSNGIYQIVNTQLAESLGFEFTRIEGKKVNSFLPSHLSDFYSSVVSFIKKSLKYIIIDGIPVANYKSSSDFQTIEIPLSDVDNNVIAIIGFTQEILPKSKSFSILDLMNSDNNLFQFMPKSIALIGKDGIFKQTTEEFRKLFETEFPDLRRLNYKRILPDDISKKIDNFVTSGSDIQKFTVKNQKGFKPNYSSELEVTLQKIFNEQYVQEGVAILIERNDEITDLEKLITGRGKMFDILIDNNPEPIFIYDAENLRFLEVNKAALDLYGYNKDEFLQMDLTDLYTPEDIQTLIENSKDSVQQGEYSGPFKHKKKDGSSVFVELSKINFKFEEKDAHFNIVRNVSEKLGLENKNKLLESVFQNTNDIVFITDSSGFILFVNKSAVDVLGFSKNDFDHSSFASFVRDDKRGAINSGIFAKRGEDSIKMELDLKKADGSFITADLTASPVLNFKDEIESFAIVVKEHAKIQSETKEIIKEVIVERPVYKTAEIPSDNSSSFLSSFFHEILTPINVILGFVQELKDGISNPTQEQKESIDIISQNRERLLNSMNAVIEYSNIERNDYEINKTEIPITEIIDYMSVNISEITSTKKTEFEYGRISSSLKFITDKSKFQHLVSLIIKISSVASKENKLYFSAYPEGGDKFILSFKDNYSSISTYMLRILKNIFLVEESEESKDFGISKLTIRLAKSLLKLLGGKFEIFDETDKKADYGFVFPMELSPAFGEKDESPVQPELPAESIKDEVMNNISDKETNLVSQEIVDQFSQSEENSGQDISEELELPEVEKFYESKINSSGKVELSLLRCLYIEDQVDSQILFKVQMKELKEIKFAVSFEEALPLLDNEKFDFIVMDINLQGEYNGLDALKIINKMPGYENIPIIAVTAYVLPGDKEKFIATGFSDFISKPIFREKMVSSLEKIFTMQI